MKTIGIVLNTNPFLDYHLIATVLTKEEGICKLFCSYANAKRSPFFGCFAPGHLVEIEYQSPKQDLAKLVSASLVHPQAVQIDLSYSHLDSTLKLLKTVATALALYKPAPLVYEMTLKFLEMLATAPYPETLLASFQLKILRHEGLLHISPRCTYCDQEIEKGTFVEGLFQCAHHTHHLGFSEEETKLLTSLSLLLHPRLLKEISAPYELIQWIETYFNSRIEQ